MKKRETHVNIYITVFFLLNMFGGLDPKKMQAMMKQMGIAQEEIDALRVVIECSDKKITVI